MKTFFFLLIMLWSNQANAYVDPGMGPAILQFIIAIISTITLYLGYAFGAFKKIFNKIKIFFKKKIKW